MKVYIVWQIAQEVDGVMWSPMIEYVTNDESAAKKYLREHQREDRFVNIGGVQYAVALRDVVEAEVDEKEIDGNS